MRAQKSYLRPGRTYRDGCAAGTCYEVSLVGTASRVTFTSAETPEEAIAWARRAGLRGPVELLRHLPGSRTGAVLAELVGVYA